jgi:hypothetical protein
MARNRYFNQYSPVKSEQSLIRDLVIEAIKIYGIDSYYLPRTHINLDMIYGEDGSMIFDDALEMEMYVKSYDGFMGQQDFLSKFGLQIDESITFVVSQKRFIDSMKPIVLNEYGYNILTDDPEDGSGTLLTEELYDYSGILRPREGDLIWIPMLGYMYEVAFTENIENFYQLGDVYTYEIRCNRFEYSSEKIDTGVASIDIVEDHYSLSTDFIEKLLDEDDTLLLHEDESRIVNEGDSLSSPEVASDNNTLSSELLEGDVVDFSETNPFAKGF